MKLKNAFSFLALVFISFSALAQDEAKCQEIDNKKAVKAYEQGIDKKNKKEERLAFLQDAIKMEPDYVDANFAFAMERIKTLAYADQSFKPTEPYFKKVIEICPKYHPYPYYFLGFIYYDEENWEESAKNLKLFLNFKPADDAQIDKDYDAYLSQAKEMLKYAKLYGEILNHPVPFDPKPVPGICTEKAEYLPMITADDDMMLFIRRMPYVDKNGGTPGVQSDREIELFSYSKRDQSTGLFTKGSRMPYPFNKGTNEGSATMSIDNKHIYFTYGADEGGEQINIDIYHSDLVDGEWTEPEKVPGINDPIAWDSQPTLASDGVTLYFASDRKGGYGGTDIYKTVKDQKTGVWSKPENLGRTINTSLDERTPFMHSDFETMYFSSNGHPGVGNLDIFYSRLGEDGKWTEPKNIGVPINTKSDDFGFFVSTDGHYGYFASDEPSRTLGRSVGKSDIFSFELYQDARPQDVHFLKGKVEDKSNGEVKNFTVEVTDAVTKKVTKGLMDSLTGDFTAVTKAKNDVIITIKKDGYAFSSKLVSKDSLLNSKPKKIGNIVTDTIAIGKTYALNDIYYNTNSATLDPRSMIVIDEFVAFLKANPTFKIEIHGHTDNVGKPEANLALSTDRAFTVRDILIEKGIDEKRLVHFQGFGATKPIADNSTEAGRSKNRRTEFVIVGK
ncbi:MAG: outer membrane protein/peptidoglycan-associated protein [Bacteroidetes bacterium]|nr:outer membrane protein/peptidoglycan-associated protein [Bacteroidota bacterium]